MNEQRGYGLGTAEADGADSDVRVLCSQTVLSRATPARPVD